MSAFNAQFDDDPAAYDELRDCWLNTRRLDHVRSFVTSLPSGARVLEIGSGTGRLLTQLAREREDLTFVGVEPVPEYVTFASGRARDEDLHHLSFRRGTAESLTSDDLGGSADLVLTNDVLHHVRDTGATVRAVRGVATPGVTWLAIEPAWINPYVFQYHVRTEGERLFFPRRFARDAGRAGWDLVDTRRMFLIPTAIPRPPRWLVTLERALERAPVLSGGIALRFRAR